MFVEHIDALGHPLVQMAMDSPHFYKNLPFFKHYFQKTSKTAAVLMNFFADQIKEHEKEIEHDKESNDFVHAFIHEWRRLDEAGEKHYFS